jgi:hypothetical protein
VSHRESAVEVWRRGASDEWTCSVAREGDTVLLGSIGAKFELGELYRALAEPAA